MGSLYALIALGYTMVYGILKFINFAHSDIVALGGWLSFVLATKLFPALGAEGSLPWWAAAAVMLLCMGACALLGFLIEFLAYRPLRKAPRLNVLITAIGVSLLLQNVGQLPFVFGARPQPMPALVPVEPWIIGEVRINPVDVLVTVTAIILMLLLQFLVYRTKLGTAMRAVSFSVPSASLVGINVNFVISFTFMLGSALAAAAGMLFAVKYNLQQTAHPQWVILGLTAFVAAVVGGVGNIKGAMLGAYLISFIQQLGTFALLKGGYDNASGLKDIYVFVVLIIVLLIKPEGLLGKPTREKV